MNCQRKKLEPPRPPSTTRQSASKEVSGPDMKETRKHTHMLSAMAPRGCLRSTTTILPHTHTHARTRECYGQQIKKETPFQLCGDRRRQHTHTHTHTHAHTHTDAPKHMQSRRRMNR
ncbi:uncharacterized protein PAE49_016578 [Odontesthes bonariensis]